MFLDIWWLAVEDHDLWVKRHNYWCLIKGEHRHMENTIVMWRLRHKSDREGLSCLEYTEPSTGWRHRSCPSDYIAAWRLRCQVISKLHILRWDSIRPGQEHTPGKLSGICTMKTTSSHRAGTHSNSILS